jgi:hypothetical protein
MGHQMLKVDSRAYTPHDFNQIQHQLSPQRLQPFEILIDLISLHHTVQALPDGVPSTKLSFTFALDLLQDL